MGGNQSTRRLTLLNDETAGIIKISDNLAHRLKGQIDDAATRTPPPTPSSPPLPPPPTVPPPPIRSPPPPSTPRSSEASGAQWTSSIAPEEAKRALGRLQQEQEAAMASLEEAWKKKMLQREKEFVETSSLLVKETQKTASEVEGAFQKAEQPLAANIAELEQKVVDCYKQNPRQTLNCSAAVQELMRSVNLTGLENPVSGKA